MNVYSILLFVAVAGAIGIFVGMGSWLIGITAIDRVSRVEQVRTLIDMMRMTRYVVPASALLTIASGLTMTLTTWGMRTGWILVAIGGLFIIGPTGAWVVDPKVHKIAIMAHALPDGPAPTALTAHTHGPLLHIALHTLVATLTGIVFLMTTKPDFSTSIGAMLVSLLLSLASSLSLLRRYHRSPEQNRKRSMEGMS
jgi:hypothetical protein